MYWTIGIVLLLVLVVILTKKVIPKYKEYDRKIKDINYGVDYDYEEDYYRSIAQD